ncbi:hypothetical protein ACF1B0_21490 [Streptomyces anandii]|uniref:hypothetical protein n=1 Tax=Streptomyces anandii TaxID=285454 RepID=UPI0036F5533D
MARTTPHTRTLMAACASVALAVLTAGCTQGSSAGSPSPVPPSGRPTGTPGRAHVEGPGVDLTVTDAVAHLDRSGDGSLSMRVKSDDDAPEHLGMVATTEGGRGVLVGAKSAEGSGSLTTAGILVLSGTTVTFGGSGPRILLHHVHGVTAEHTLPLILQFGLAGMVRVQARVTSS